MTSKWLAIVQALLAGAVVLTAGATLADVIGVRWAALLGLLVAAGQAAVAAYTAGPHVATSADIGRHEAQ
jgi:hypothetical protein